MQPYNLNPGPEALRWLDIADKLLTNRDLIGSKTFATRARDADPRLEQADQILAIVDTLIAGEKQISNQNLDWYAILQLARRTHDSELIASQYRRLAVLLNPNMNKFPFAEHAFKLVSEAWLVLSNPSRKFQFDNEFGNSSSTHFNFIQQHFEPPPPPPPQHSNNSTHFNFIQEHSEQLHQPLQQQQQFLPPFPQQPPLPQQPPPQALNQQHQLQRQSFPQQQPPPRPQPQQPMFRPQPQQTFPRPQPQQPLARPQPQPQPQPQNPFLRPLAQQSSPRSLPEQTSPRPLPQQPSPRPFPQQPSPKPLPEQISPRPFPQQPSPRPLPQQPSSQPQTQQQPDQSLPQPREQGENESLHKGNNSINGQVSGDNYGNINNDANVDESPSFWTACPYCFNMYEYPAAYAECTLRCQNCKRAFHAVTITAPPPFSEGKDASIFCWGFFPLASSMSHLEKSKAGASNWSPFSTMFAVPQGENNANAGKSNKGRRNAGPWIIIDEDEDFVDFPSSDDSDDDWRSNMSKKKSKSAKRKISTTKIVKHPQVDKGKKVKVGGGTPEGGVVAQDGAGVGVPNVAGPNAAAGETSKKAVAVTTRKQPSRVAKDLGKLDLNVEFSNEVEEPAARTSGANRAGNGVEDNIEGIAFFEGLDEFLSSLPILSVVGDDKVKAS